jgi:putative transposase
MGLGSTLTHPGSRVGGKVFPDPTIHRKELFMSEEYVQIKKSDFSFDIEKAIEKFKNNKNYEEMAGPGGALTEMLKMFYESALQAEQELHLGYKPHKKSDPYLQKNSRNGYSKKTFKTSTGGEVPIEIPRDRDGTFEPKIIKKHQRFDPTLEKQITGMYARGMSTRDIQSQLEQFYGTDVSPAYISLVTDKLLDGITEWQMRPLQEVYAVVFLDAIHYKIRQDSKVITKAAYSVLGVTISGVVEVLGIWIAENEGAHFWQSVLSDLKSRGVRDILIACVDGLKGFPEAINHTFPHTQVQLCVVHQIRNSMRYVGSKHHKEFVADLKTVYRADNIEMAEAGLTKLDEKWGSKYPSAVQSWKSNWLNLSTFFQFPAEVRKMIYTTNAVEALHRQFRKVTKTKSSFPTDDSLKKMLYLATINLTEKFRTKQNWALILGQLKIVFQDRIPEKMNF